MGEQPEPHRLQYILGITRTQPSGPGDLPEQRAELRDEVADRVLAAVSGRLYQAGDPRGMIIPRWCGTGGAVLDGGHPGHPRSFSEFLARSIAAAPPGRSSRIPPWAAAPRSRPLANCAAR